MAYDLRALYSFRPFKYLPIMQLNKTTKNLTQLLYKNDDPITVVTHSQGCLIMRNAMASLSLLSRQDALNKVNWVATGMPMSDNELDQNLIEKLNRFEKYIDNDDIVATWLSGSGGNDLNQIEDHSFIEEYVDDIKAEDIWGGFWSLVMHKWRLSLF